MPSVIPTPVELQSPDPTGRGAFCLAHTSKGVITAVIGIRTGNNCCAGVAVVPTTGNVVGGQRWFALDGNDLRVATIGGLARIATSFWMGCTNFWSCAGGGSSLVIDNFDGTRLVDVTSRFPKLLAVDARSWRYTIATGEHAWIFGDIPAWVADECRAGSEQAAWHWVDRRLAAGHLRGNPYKSTGRHYVKFLHKFLTDQHFCTQR